MRTSVKLGSRLRKVLFRIDVRLGLMLGLGGHVRGPESQPGTGKNMKSMETETSTEKSKS